MREPTCVFELMRRTRVPAIAPTSGSSFSSRLLTQTATVIQEGDAWESTTKSTSLWAQEAQQAPSRMWKGVYPRFSGLFFCPRRSVALFSALAQRREQGKMPPGPFRELSGEVGAEIGA